MISDARKPNENFARELLELFTVGIGNYGERDIKEIARALTGWTLDAPPGTKKQPTVADAPRAFCRDGLVPTTRPVLLMTAPLTSSEGSLRYIPRNVLPATSGARRAGKYEFAICYPARSDDGQCVVAVTFDRKKLSKPPMNMLTCSADSGPRPVAAVPKAIEYEMTYQTMPTTHVTATDWVTVATTFFLRTMPP